MEIGVYSWIALFILVGEARAAVGTRRVDLDLNLGYVKGYSEAIKFIKKPLSTNIGRCAIQSVIMLNFSGEYKSAKFRLYYGQKPRSWTFHLSESKEARGNGGAMTSSSRSRSDIAMGLNDVTSHDHNAELRIHNRQLKVFGNSANGVLEETNGGNLLLKGINRFVKRNTYVELNISEGRLQWNNRGKNRELKSHFLFSMNENFPLNPYHQIVKRQQHVIYAGFNRVVAGNFRSGTGLCRVEITLFGGNTEINSCATGKHDCHKDATCITISPRIVDCKCKPGFYGTGKLCEENNECKTNNGGCVHHCTNTPGNYSCSCYTGFELSPDGHNCIDKNECLENRGGCSHQCRNNVGSHQCLCNDGYHLHRNGLDCAIGDWCRKTLGCQHHCRDESGAGVRCACRAGYILSDNGRCIRTCSVGNGGCQHICRNSVDKVTCRCAPGYRLQSDNSTCIASCGINRGGCSKRCRDTLTGPVCSCPSGYQLHQDGKTCLDINECLRKNGGCSHTCINRKGGYECVCPPGYRVRSLDKKCVDINECAVNSTCEHTCVNTPGSYRCECRRGYQIYGNTHCADKNECSDNNGGCKFNCRNTIGGFQCPCPRGYRQHPNKKDCDKAEKCLQLKEPAKAELKCSRVRNTETCRLQCRRGAQFTAYLKSSFTYQCGKMTQYMWVGEGAQTALPSCSITVGPPDLKRKARFYFKTSHCSMHEKTKSLFNRSLINNILDRKRYPCTGDCRLKDIHVRCQAKKERREGRTRNRPGRFKSLSTRRQNLVIAEFDLEVMPSSASAKCDVECIKRKTKRKMKKTIRKMRRHISRNDFLVSWDNDRVRVDKRSFKAQRIKLSCKPGQVLVIDKCVSCSVGMFFNKRAGKCESCPSGTYQNREGQTSCIPCPNHKAASGIIGAKDRSECEALCIPGYYSEDGHKPCVPCNKGYYQPDYGRTGCIKCGDHIDTSGLASTGFHQCIVRDFCNAGQFYSHKSKKCKPCPRGTYQHTKGQNFCVACPGNTTTDHVGAVNSSLCKAHNCGGHIGKYQGYFESPNYPGEYPSNTDCRWFIRAHRHRRILVVVPEIFLPEGDKCGDQLSMRKTQRPDSLTSYEVCKTIRRPYAFTASSRKMWVKFKSNGRNSSTGFSIPYVTYNKEYQGLIDDIVGDQRLYTSHQHQQILKDRKLLSGLLEVIAVPKNYFKYANVSNVVLPKSFIRLLTSKIKRFFS